MFSESFMRYLINYQKDDCLPESDTVKKIKFKPTNNGETVKVRVRIKD